MNSTSSTVTQAFTGTLQVGGETVPAVVRFADGSVSLVVGEDEVGAWPQAEVGFVDVAGGYDIRAEGDSIRFLPDHHSEFSQYARSPQPEAPGPSQTINGPGSPLSPATGNGLGDGDAPGRADEPPDPPADSPDPARPVPEVEPTAEPLGEGAADEIRDALAGLHDEGQEEDPEETADETGISVGEPDEYFAAGLNGPPGQSPPPGFHSAITPPASPHGEEAGPDGGEGADSVPDRDDPPAAADHTQPDPGPVMLSETVQQEDEVPGEFEENRENGENGEIDWATPIGPRDSDDTGEAPASEAEPPSTETEETSPSRLTRLFQRVRSTGTEAPEEVPSPNEDDELPVPISDSDNLKQWLLVTAGGFVLLVILGMVAWGLISLMGSDDPDVGAEPVPTTVPAPAATTPATAPPATAPPPTTVPPENAAAATAFVTTWNELASDYAYHLTISADSLPIATAPAPTVHLTYGEDGVLLLTMAPKGTGADHDILVSMGLAVAWADPGLNPEGRKQLLAALGIDVDDPQVADMGGEVERNGVSYSTQVEDGIIRFEVDPAG